MWAISVVFKCRGFWFELPLEKAKFFAFLPPRMLVADTF